LVEFAKYTFYWGGKQSDGASAHEHAESAKKNCLASLVITDQTFADTPDICHCPVEVEYVWSWFRELDATRQNSMSIGPITNVEIDHWARLMNIDLLPFEVQAIREIDIAYINNHNSKDKKNG
jgi:hypothetical protein